jgi:hypothetical protein
MTVPIQQLRLRLVVRMHVDLLRQSSALCCR